MSVPHCINCGYCLGSLPEPRCPECGSPFDLEDPSTFVIVRPPDEDGRVLDRFMVFGVGLVLLIVLGLVAVALLFWFSPARLGPMSWT